MVSGGKVLQIHFFGDSQLLDTIVDDNRQKIAEESKDSWVGGREVLSSTSKNRLFRWVDFFLSGRFEHLFCLQLVIFWIFQLFLVDFHRRSCPKANNQQRKCILVTIGGHSTPLDLQLVHKFVWILPRGPFSADFFENFPLCRSKK